MAENSTLQTDQDIWNVMFERFNRTVEIETENLMKNIKENQKNMINERETLKKEIEQLKQERQEMTRILKKYDQIVTLNIGGQIFSTTAETLTKEECLFTKLLSGRYQPVEVQGAIFIDRDPTHFRKILNYIRTNTFIRPTSTEECAEILIEAEHYQITTLIKQLRNENPSASTSIEHLKFDAKFHHPGITVSTDGITAIHGSGCAKGLYVKAANVAWNKGRHYWEIIFQTEPRCYSSMGVATSSWNSDIRLGDDQQSWTLRTCHAQTASDFGGLRHNSQSLSYYNQFPKGTHIGLLLDMDVGTIEYVVNGERKGVAFNNLKGHTVVTPVFELCNGTTFQMNHRSTLPNF